MQIGHDEHPAADRHLDLQDILEVVRRHVPARRAPGTHRFTHGGTATVAVRGHCVGRRYYGRAVPPRQDVPPPLDRISGWTGADGWAARYRRLGPLRYSDLGPRKPPVPADGDLGTVAAWLAGLLDRWWREAGCPDPFAAVVVSGDDGRLASEVLGSGPDCLGALRYVMVGGEAPAGMALEEPAMLFPAATSARTPVPGGPAAEQAREDEEPDGPPPPATGVGPLVTWLAELPVLADTASGDPIEAAVLCIGYLSSLPFDLYRWADGCWYEVRLAFGEAGGAGEAGAGASEVLVAAGGAALPDATDPAGGSDFVRRSGAVEWLRKAFASPGCGHLAVLDRWTATGPVRERDQAAAIGPTGPALDLAQLSGLRRPLEDAPVPVVGDMAAVTWRLG